MTVPPSLISQPGSLVEEPTTRIELWAWWIYNFAFEPISIVLGLSHEPHVSNGFL